MLTIFNIIFPIIGLFIFILLYIFSSKNNHKIISYNCFYSFAYLSYIYNNIMGKGDISRYILHNKNYLYFNSVIEIFQNSKLSYTYIWSLVNYLVCKFNFKFQIISFFSVLIIFHCIFKIIEIFKIEFKMKKILLIKFFMLFSLPLIFSSYRNLLAFSLIAVGILYDIKEKRKSFVYFFLGIGIHMASIPVTIIYFFSKFFKYNIKIFYIVICFFIITNFKKIKYSIYLILSNFENPLIKKVRNYLFGKWSEYKIFFLGDILTYYLLFIVLLLIFVTFFKIYKLKRTTIEFKKYNNFILYYITFFILFIPYRTIAIRFFVTGFPFFILYFYEILKINKNNFIYKVIFYALLIDIRWISLFFSNDFIFGKGFPYLIFENLFKYL